VSITSRPPLPNTLQVKDKFTLRLVSDFADEERYENPGILQQFPDKIGRNISNTMHENARKVQGLPPYATQQNNRKARRADLKRFGYPHLRDFIEHSLAVRDLQQRQVNRERNR
jgi:hypothetical protein